MNPLIGNEDRGVTVIGGGEVPACDLAEALAVAPLLVAADGGADRALALGRMPDWVIGDLDSIGEAARRRIPPERIWHVAEQDSTDFSKCLTRIRAAFVLAVGFVGRRMDHTLAALSAMAAPGLPPVIMLAAEDILFLAPSRLDLPLSEGSRVSLYPLGPVRGKSSGLEWPIDGLDFAPAGRVGTSNRALGPVSLELAGPMLVILPREALGLSIAALRLPA